MFERSIGTYKCDQFDEMDLVVSERSIGTCKCDWIDEMDSVVSERSIGTSKQLVGNLLADQTSL